MDIAQFELQAKIEDAHWWFRARREIMRDILKKHLPSKERRSIAEIGCGTGGNLKYFQKHYRVIGVDISPEAVRYSTERTDCEVLLGDFRDKLLGRWDEIDAVILPDVLEHVNEDAAFLEDLVSNLRVGALILLTVPAHEFLWSTHDLILGHKRRYSLTTLSLLWKSLPVEELFFTPFNTLLFPPIALYRMIRRNSSNRKGSDLTMPAPWLNFLLYKIFSADRKLLKLFRLPFGVSYLAVLRKKERTGQGKKRSA